MHHRNNKSTMLFIGLAALTGAFVALLITPQNGKQMRKTLRRRYEGARNAMEDLGDRTNDWIEKGSDWAEKAKRKVA
jgi:gas vesicle protein